jgi:hypothetical protein
MCNICSQKYHRLIEYLSKNSVGNKNTSDGEFNSKVATLWRQNAQTTPTLVQNDEDILSHT